ncbi:phosphoinositide-interacting protein isoform X3 [Danio rerio]|uniref:Phosphoinositide-interacting protein isoform X3 n=1 Tax=Danio rerio TaxID=7955 RepID=A0AC58J164_DANRE
MMRRAWRMMRNQEHRGIGEHRTRGDQERTPLGGEKQTLEITGNRLGKPKDTLALGKFPATNVHLFHLCSSSLISRENTCSIIFMSGDWAGKSWSTLTFFAFRSFDVEAEV